MKQFKSFCPTHACTTPYGVLFLYGADYLFVSHVQDNKSVWVSPKITFNLVPAGATLLGWPNYGLNGGLNEFMP